MYWLNFDSSIFGVQSFVTSSGQTGLSAQPENDLKKALKRFFYVIFVFWFHLPLKIHNTKRFWHDVFVRIMNHSIQQVVKSSLLINSSDHSDPFDWRVSTHQFNNGMNESSPVNHLSTKVTSNFMEKICLRLVSQAVCRTLVSLLFLCSPYLPLSKLGFSCFYFSW